MYSNRIQPASLLVLLALLVGASVAHAQTPQWLPIGPFNANYGALTISPDGVIFASRSLTSELYISSDRGSSWLIRPLPGEGSLLTDVHSTLYLVTNGGDFFRTSNRGISWDTLIVDAALAARPVAAMYPTLSGNLVATLVHTGGDTLGVYLSTDGGGSWVATARISATIKIVGTGIDGSLIAFRGAALLRSTDVGASWVETYNDLESNVASFLRAPDGRLLVATILGRIYRSLDHGSTWERSGAVPDTIKIRSFGMDSSGAIWLGWLDGIRPIVSSDDGASWRFVVTGFPGVPAYIGTWRDMIVLSTGTEGMIVSQDRGGTWRKSYVGLPGLSMVGVVALSDTSILAIDRSGDVYRGSWQRVAAWDRIRTRAYLALYHGYRGNIVMVINGTAYRTTNRGASWDTSVAFSFLQSTAVDFDRDGALLVASAGVWRTTDLGAAWSQLDQTFSGSVSALAVDSLGRIYAGTPLGELYILDSRTSRMRQLPLGGAVASINDIMVTPAGVVLVAIDGGGLRRSTDWGESWSDASVGLTSLYPRALSVERRGALLAATNRGIFISVNQGESWTEIPTPFRGGAMDIDVDDEGWVIAATATGLYRTNQTVSAIPMLDASRGMALQAAPNPIRERAILTLTLPSARHLTVRVVTASGDEIAILHRGMLGEGSHNLSWNAEGLAGGVYFVRAESAAGTLTEPLVLQR